MLLNRVGKFFDWHREHNPRRSHEAALALRRFDPAQRALPGALESLNVKHWDHMRDFFVAVAHHRTHPEMDEFAKWVAALERFLLDLLVPRTFADFDEIDSLLAEGESDA